MLHKELWQQLTTLDRQQTSQRSLCNYNSETDSYEVVLLNREFLVDLPNQEIYTALGGSEAVPANFIEQLSILAYLISAKQLPLANKLVKAESLPGGEFFFRGPHVLPASKLADAFGSDPQLLIKFGTKFGAKKCDFGDASIEIMVLPRVPLTIVVWAGDEEFSARGSILFDQTAADQMALDALGAAVAMTVNALVARDK